MNRKLQPSWLDSTNELSGEPGAVQELVPETAWPEAFRVLAPEAVSVDSDGAYVTMDVDTIDASGLYVAFDVKVRPQDLGPDLSFQALAPGISWYELVMGGQDSGEYREGGPTKQ